MFSHFVQEYTISQRCNYKHLTKLELFPNPIKSQTFLLPEGHH